MQIGCRHMNRTCPHSAHMADSRAASSFRAGSRSDPIETPPLVPLPSDTRERKAKEMVPAGAQSSYARLTNVRLGGSIKYLGKVFHKEFQEEEHEFVFSWRFLK